MCRHTPPCPGAGRVDEQAARVVSSHPDQGWSLLCNGVIVFDDTGTLRPAPTPNSPLAMVAGRPRRGPARHATVNAAADTLSAV